MNIRTRTTSVVMMLALAGAILVTAGATAQAGTRSEGNLVLFTDSQAAFPSARCGAFPPNLQIESGGQGNDTVAGPFDWEQNFCVDTSTGLIFDYNFSQTFLASGDVMMGTCENFSQVLDANTCNTSNAAANGLLRCSITGGTGAWADLSGIRDSKFAIPSSNCLAANGEDPHLGSIWYSQHTWVPEED